MLKNKMIPKRHFITAIAFIAVVFALSMFLTSGNFDISRLTENSPANTALKYYQEKHAGEAGMDGVRAAVVKLGCHQEIRIYKGDQLLMKASYANGQIYEIN